MNLKLKICGMREEENIRNVGDLCPDYMGFIFYRESPRFVGDEFSVPEFSGVNKVGVFVKETEKEVIRKVKKHSLDYVQLHGGESMEYCQEIQSNGVKIIKVFSVHDNFDFESVKPFAKVSDYFLFDTKGKFYGGNAQQFNWTILNRYDQEVPFFLSGGLSAKSIGDIRMLKGMNLHAVDVNSCVEISPGVKDLNAVRFLKEELLTFNGL